MFLLRDLVEQLAQHESTKSLPRVAPPWLAPKPGSRKGSSHIQLVHPNKAGAYTWAFHDDAEIGPNMLRRIAKHTGLKPEDL